MFFYFFIGGVLQFFLVLFNIISMFKSSNKPPNKPSVLFGFIRRIVADLRNGLRRIGPSVLFGFIHVSNNSRFNNYCLYYLQFFLVLFFIIVSWHCCWSLYYPSVLFGFIQNEIEVGEEKYEIRDPSVLFGFILRGSPIREWGLQFFRFLMFIIVSIIFLFVVLFKLYLLLFSSLDWAALFYTIYVLLVHRDVVGSSLTYMFSCSRSIRTYSIF